jgi:hypothetical protein
MDSINKDGIQCIHLSENNDENSSSESIDLFSTAHLGFKPNTIRI